MRLSFTSRVGINCSRLRASYASRLRTSKKSREPTPRCAYGKDGAHPEPRSQAFRPARFTQTTALHSGTSPVLAIRRSRFYLRDDCSHAALNLHRGRLKSASAGRLGTKSGDGYCSDIVRRKTIAIRARGRMTGPSSCSRRSTTSCAPSHRSRLGTTLQDGMFYNYAL